jgi:hypothetical protein
MGVAEKIKEIEDEMKRTQSVPLPERKSLSSHEIGEGKIRPQNTIWVC